MKKTKIAVVGCGRRIRDILKLLMHENQLIEIVAFIDEDIKYANELKNEFANEAKEYTDLDLALDIEKPKWLLIGSRNFLHAEHILKAFEKNIHVFVEKPLAINKEDCLKIYQLQLEKKLCLMIGFTLRYSPHYQKIASLLHQNAIGKVISFEFNETLDFWHGTHIMCNWRRFRQYTGFHMLEKCCHDIDIANWFFQTKARKVSSFGGLNFFIKENKDLANTLSIDPINFRKPYERYGHNAFETKKDIVDNQVVILEYENGVRGTFHTNLNSAIPERRFYILGTKGSIRSDVLTGKIELRKIGFQEQSIDVSIPNCIGGHGGGDKILAKELLQSIIGASTPQTTARDGLLSAFTCFAIDEAQRKSRVVSLKKDWATLTATEQKQTCTI